MSNNEFTELYNETQTNLMQLRNMPITKLKVWFVEANGLGDVGDIESCADFAAITYRGSVVITGNLGPFLKVNDDYWVRTEAGATKKPWSDINLVHQLICEYGDNDYIATIIDPRLE